jgi:hypothetical protein
LKILLPHKYKFLPRKYQSFRQNAFVSKIV